MSNGRDTLGRILVVGAALAVVSGALHAVDPGVNQRGARGGTAGVGAPGAGVRDPGVNQPGAAGNVGAPGVGVGAPGVGVRDPGINQPGAAGNVGAAGVARRRIIATSTVVAALPPGCKAVVIEGTKLQQCGSTYYKPSGNQYTVVKVE
jgi:hypothetical protein